MARKGYTKIENWLLDFLYSSQLEHSELLVLIFLIRYTKGFNRDMARASTSYISQGTNLCENSVRRAMKNLIKKGYIEVAYEHSGSKAQILKVMYQSIEGSYTQRMSFHVPNECGINVPNECTQDIKEYIKDKDIKDNKKASPLFPTKNINDYTVEEAHEWQEKLSAEDWQLFLNGKVWKE